MFKDQVWEVMASVGSSEIIKILAPENRPQKITSSCGRYFNNFSMLTNLDDGPTTFLRGQFHLHLYRLNPLGIQMFTFFHSLLMSSFFLQTIIFLKSIILLLGHCCTVSCDLLCFLYHSILGQLHLHWFCCFNLTSCRISACFFFSSKRMLRDTSIAW